MGVDEAPTSVVQQAQFNQNLSGLSQLWRDFSCVKAQLPSWSGLYITFSHQCSVYNGPSFKVQLHYLSWHINRDTNHLTLFKQPMPQHSPMTSSDSSCLFHIFWVYAVTLECHLLQVCNIFSGISLVETHPLMIKFLRRALRTTV